MAPLGCHFCSIVLVRPYIKYFPQRTLTINGLLWSVQMTCSSHCPKLLRTLLITSFITSSYIFSPPSPNCLKRTAVYMVTILLFSMTVLVLHPGNTAVLACLRYILPGSVYPQNSYTWLRPQGCSAEDRKLISTPKFSLVVYLTQSCP